MQNKANLSIELDTLIHVHTELNPFHSQTTITGLAFSGEIALFSDSSLVRMILMDDHYNEYLIYEAYPILSGSGQFSVFEAAEETSLLNNITPDRVTLELINASVHIKEFTISEEGTYQSNTKSARLLQLTLNKIELINKNIEKAGQTWLAGETSISKLSYQEKKSMFGGRVPNFQGFEYYIGGVFVLPDAKGENPVAKGPPLENLGQQNSQYPDEFSWQNRHGINWVTPAKNQGGTCGGCFAFGTTAAAELLVNLYFNRLLNYDLSEQNMVSCTAGSCKEGGLITSTLDYMKYTGIVLEDCFPYTASDLGCSEICNDPSERIKIEYWHVLRVKENKKKEIIKGATVGDIHFWKHIAQVVGYKNLDVGEILYQKEVNNSIMEISIEEGNPLIGETAWLIKNSWGRSWGTDGFGYVVGGDLGVTLVALVGPVNSMIYNEGDISCTDNDGDGYFNWGIGPKPSHCPESPDQADGDDSNPCIGPMDDFGKLSYLTPTPAAKDTFVLYGNSPDMYVEGSNVRWYEDKKLLDLVYTGNLFPADNAEPGKYTYYVTQTKSGCESAADDISLSIVTEIPPPIGHDTLINIGEPVILTVEGEQGAVFSWYEDPSLTNLLGKGDSFIAEKKETGVYTYYVTQTLSLIESAPDTLELRIAKLVKIPDKAFLNALFREGVDTNGDFLIDYFEAEAVESLNVNMCGITDMTGIEAFVNLDSLSCENNRLTSLDVSNNTALTNFFCSSNQLSNLDVSSNTALTQLFCSFNRLTSLDVSRNSALIHLVGFRNQLTSLDVSRNTELRVLGCGNNQLTRLNLCNNQSISYLDVAFMRTLDTVFVSSLFPSFAEMNTIDSWQVGFFDCSLIGDGFTSPQLTIYPNPTKSEITIKMDQLHHFLVDITSLNGQLIYSTTTEGIQHQIDLSSFQKGVYFITFRSEDLVLTRKIIKL